MNVNNIENIRIPKMAIQQNKYTRKHAKMTKKSVFAYESLLNEHPLTSQNIYIQIRLKQKHSLTTKFFLDITPILLKIY